MHGSATNNKGVVHQTRIGGRIIKHKHSPSKRQRSNPMRLISIIVKNL